VGTLVRRTIFGENECIRDAGEKSEPITVSNLSEVIQVKENVKDRRERCITKHRGKIRRKKPRRPDIFGGNRYHGLFWLKFFGGSDLRPLLR